MSASIRDVSMQAASAVEIARAGGETARVATETVERLGEASTQIGAIVELITAIAGQTHLLALNATIEAARAGDAGAGFAVVAQEVKDLSHQTAQATSDIAQRVRGLQDSAAAGNDAIRSIVGVIERISENQHAIAGAVEEQTATTGSIGTTLAEAARGTADIARSVTGVAEAAENTTRGAAETQRAAGDLAAMAAELQLLLSHYTTRRAPQPVSAPSAR
jgi:methyl-accepting chemotaxis protein